MTRSVAVPFGVVLITSGIVTAQCQLTSTPVPNVEARPCQSPALVEAFPDGVLCLVYPLNATVNFTPSPVIKLQSYLNGTPIFDQPGARSGQFKFSELSTGVIGDLRGRETEIEVATWTGERSKCVSVPVKLIMPPATPSASAPCIQAKLIPFSNPGFDSPVMWDPVCSATVVAFEGGENPAGRVIRALPGTVTLGDVMTRRVDSARIELRANGSSQVLDSTELKVTKDFCSSLKLNIPAYPDLSTLVRWDRTSCAAASVDAHQDGRQVRQVKAATNEALTLDSLGLRPGRAEIKIGSGLAEASDAVTVFIRPADFRELPGVFQDNFTYNRCWVSRAPGVTEELASEFHGTGSSEVSLVEGGGLKLWANSKGRSQSVHVIAGCRLLDAPLQPGPVRYRFVGRLHRQYEQTTEVVLEGSVQITDRQGFTHVLAVQHNANPLSSDSYAWRIWSVKKNAAAGTPAGWIEIGKSQIQPDTDYSVAIEADLSAPPYRYRRVTVSGEGLNLTFPLDDPIVPDRRGFEPATVVTLELENRSSNATDPTVTQSVATYKLAELYHPVMALNLASGAEIIAPGSAALFKADFSAVETRAAALPLPGGGATNDQTIRFGKECAANSEISRPVMLSQHALWTVVPAAVRPGDTEVCVYGGDTLIVKGFARIAAVAPGLFTAGSDGTGACVGLARICESGLCNDYPLAVCDQGFACRPAPLPAVAASALLDVTLYGTGVRNGGADLRALINSATGKVLGVEPDPALGGVDLLKIQVPAAALRSGEENTIRLNAGGSVESNSCLVLVR